MPFHTFNILFHKFSTSDSWATLWVAQAALPQDRPWETLSPPSILAWNQPVATSFLERRTTERERLEFPPQILSHGGLPTLILHLSGQQELELLKVELFASALLLTFLFYVMWKLIFCTLSVVIKYCCFCQILSGVLAIFTPSRKKKHCCLLIGIFMVIHSYSSVWPAFLKYLICSE